MSLEKVITVVLPYTAAVGLVVLVAMGKISPELAAVLAGALALPSPVSHALEALKGKPVDPPEEQ